MLVELDASFNADQGYIIIVIITIPWVDDGEQDVVAFTWFIQVVGSNHKEWTSQGETVISQFFPKLFTSSDSRHS